MDIKKQIQLLVKELNGKVGYPTTTAVTDKMESELDLEFPKEYKEFLQTFGWIDATQEIFGGGKNIPKILSAVKETLELRKDYPDTFPKNVVAIHHDGRGNYYCLVCDGKDFGKVIFWQHDVRKNIVYPNNPPDKESDFWIEGTDFWIWLLETYQATKKGFEEFKEEMKTLREIEKEKKEGNQD